MTQAYEIATYWPFPVAMHYWEHTLQLLCYKLPLKVSNHVEGAQQLLFYKVSSKMHG